MGRKIKHVNIDDVGDHNVLLEDHLRDVIKDHLKGIGIPKDEYGAGYRIALELVLSLLNGPSSLSDLIRPKQD